MRAGVLRPGLLVVTAWLAAAGCAPPALVSDAKELALLSALEREFSRSVAAEKSAVLATTDEESAKFAAESRAASAEVERVRRELRAQVAADERPQLDAFDAAWAKVVEIDAKLLPLAVANTNLKAAALSRVDAMQSLDAVLAGLEAAGAKTKDPARLRALWRASTAALRIQALHAPHIATPDDAEMTALEGQMRALEATVDAVLADPRSYPRAEAGDLAGAAKAWARYEAVTARILELSRANTNVVSFELSVHAKSDAEKACAKALQDLADGVHARLRAQPRPTR